MIKRLMMIAAMICVVGMSSLVQADDKQVILLKGHIQVEGSNEDVAFATITLQDDSANVVKKLASDASGHFDVKVNQAGKYRLIFSAVGYSAMEQDVVVEAGVTNKDLGVIKMNEGVELTEVTVSAQKPLIKSDPDKLVYSVESDPDSKSNTLLEMIRKVPLLSVDAEENVTLNGQSNYKVLVNGKSSSLMSNNFKEVIKSMPANSIKDIEVITNPSSKYEAEGVGGIINIITAKNTNNGYTGSVGANADSRGGYGVNGYISANINKFSFSTNIYTNTYRQPETEGFSNRENFERDDKHYVDSKSRSKYRGSGNSLNFEAGYEIDTFNLISASAWGYFGNYKSNSSSMSETRNVNNDPIQRYTNTYDSKNGYGYLSGNIDYQRSYMKKDKTLTASYKLDYNPDNTKYNNNVDGEIGYETYRQKSDNESSGQTHTFQLDYFDPLTDKHQIEAGVKAIYRRNFSETDIQRLDSTSPDWYKDVDRINDLDYNQYIMGMYAGYLFKYKKTSTKVGVRGEYTWNDGVSKSEIREKFDNNYFNIIPYVNFSYSLKPTQTIKASYTQRLYRPGIWSLNPYVNDVDPMNISYGNPNLKEEIAHSFNVTYSNFSPKFNVNISLNAAITDDAIERYSFVDEGGVIYSTYDNIGSNQRYGANIYASYRPNGKINIYLNSRINYNILKANKNLDITNEGVNAGGNLGARFVFWKGGSVSANAGGSTPWIMLQGKSSGYYYTQFGVSQKFMKDKMEVACYISDPFWNKIYYKSDYDDPTYTMHTENYRFGQTVRLSATWRFGKMNTQVKKARRGISNDDQRSGEGGGGGSQGGGGQ
ncbi:MAG: TonB-dependent receptor [Tannerella sp.]|jgi:outer membrane receptor protein involved in Fe transport|nr:TonB-dependent receptor [Tannerella sp.]